MSGATRRLARHYAQRINGAAAQRNTYREMARRLRMMDPTYRDDDVNHEVARLNSIANEYDGEVDHLIEEAAAQGFTPDDLEAA